jgi:hypothetical protein
MAGDADVRMAVSAMTSETFSPGTPRVLFSGSQTTPPLLTAIYDVAFDGSRFVMVR